MQLRAAKAADLEHIATLWHAAWHDAHAALVPPALLPHRSLEHFRGLAEQQWTQITVAVQAGAIAGFAGVDDDELELLFVHRTARGTGVAGALIGWGEREIARRFARAYLVVVEGNARARSFYERCGWRDVGLEDYVAMTPEGGIPVSSRRYEKSVV